LQEGQSKSKIKQRTNQKTKQKAKQRTKEKRRGSSSKKDVGNTRGIKVHEEDTALKLCCFLN
jgi:hypothetical protein